MTRTELKVKLAEQILPLTKEVVTYEDKKLHLNNPYDYQLAEDIINFLVKQGVNLEDGT